MSDEPLAKPRKNPVQSRSRATVEAILQAATRILVEGGVERLNTNAIAERAGVSVGSLYQYFPNKAAIVNALIREKRARLLADMRAAAAGTEGAPMAEAVAALLRATVRHQRDWPQLSRVLDRAALLVPLQDETEALERAIFEVVAGVLRARGIDPPDLAALDLIALSRGMIFEAVARGETDEAALVARVMRAASGYLGFGGD